jgi:hypothetical protein
MQMESVGTVTVEKFEKRKLGPPYTKVRCVPRHVGDEGEGLQKLR